MTAQQTVAWAASQIGQHETPWGSNRVPYWTDVLPSYQGGQWCGAFAFDALMHGGADLSWTTVRRFVYTPWGLADARAAGIFYTDTPRPGDVVWFDLDGRPGPEHVGIVAAAGNGVHIHTIEGNVGDQVKTLVRSAPQIIGYARITYPTPTGEDTDMRLVEHPGDKAVYLLGLTPIPLRISTPDVEPWRRITGQALPLPSASGAMIQAVSVPALDYGQLADALAAKGIDIDPQALAAAVADELGRRLGA